MIIEKLLHYDYDPRRGLTAEGERLMETCKADLIYYAVLKAAVEVYGKRGVARPDGKGGVTYEGGGRDIRLYNTDVLGIARDQMAMMASDQGLLQYNRDGLVERIMTPGQTEQERLANFARESFRNSEGIYNLISKHLSGLHDYPDSDARNAAVERAIDDALSDGSPVMMRVRSVIDNMSDTMGQSAQHDRTDTYAMRRPAEELVPESEGGRGEKRAIPGSRPVLKLSPLMPEFRTLRMSGHGTPLGMYRVQSAGIDNGDHNAVLAYDFERRMLTRAQEQYMTELPAAYDFASGISLGRSEFGLVDGKPMEFRGESTNVYTEGLEHRGARVRQGSMAPFYDPITVNIGACQMQAWRMAELVRKYSQQQLTDKDYEVIDGIFTGRYGNGTLFGDAFADPVGTRANEDAYFEYIEHVCSTVRDRMGSHEFEIHFLTQNYFKSDTDKGEAFVPLMWFTGERTDDYDRARSNPARYFAFYPYMDYTPANVTSTPLLGDIAPAAYNSYTVTDRRHRKGSDDINDPARNPYARVRHIDAARCRDLRDMFDGYMGIRNNPNLDIAKVRRPVGTASAQIQEMADFVNDDGTVDGRKIVKSLVDDMNAIKAYQTSAIRQPLQKARMRSVLDRFTENMRVAAYDDEGNPRPAIGDAVALFFEKCNRYGAPASDTKQVSDAQALARKLERCIRQEISDAYGKDSGSALAAKHVFDRFAARYAENCTRIWHERNNALIANGSGAHDDTSLAELFTEEAQAMVAGFTDGIESNPYGNQVERAMDELFGTVSPNGRAVIRANSCRALSRHFMTSEYNSLLTMLSYSDASVYEPSAMRSLYDVERDLQQQEGASCLIQRYAPEAYDITAGMLEDPDDDAEERDETLSTLAEERAWFDATFASTDAPEGGFEHTLAWLQRDWSTDPLTAAAESALDPDPSNPDNRLHHAVFEATHPLQCEALRAAGERLADIEGDGFDPARLAVSPQGLVYYKNESGEVVFKAGPVTDEQAYIRPCVWDAQPEDIERGMFVEIEVPLTDSEGRVLHDEKGKAYTRTRQVVPGSGLYLNEDGTLANPVEFGPLDTASLSQAKGSEMLVANRYYGLSAKIAAYDGYDHSGKAFHEREEVTGYQNLVLEGLDRQLAAYAFARSSERNPSGVLSEEGKKSMSIFYTTVGAGSLRKCYHTNTYIIEEKEKCAVGNGFMADYITTEGENWPAEAEQVADLLMAQSRSYHGMLTFPKITIDQNIGLYNQGISLQQGLVADLGDNLDRENIRDHDCLSARVAYAQAAAVHDVTDTGTAKNLGAKAFLSDVASFDWRTRQVTVDQSPQDQAGTNTRQPFNAIGIESFVDGGITMRPIEYPDGQPVDRIQLSNNGMHKAVMHAKDVRFAMVNLGYNMEDGYIVAGRAAHKFGHFNEDLEFVPAQLWDKIGDTESGNKGVIAKIVDTETGYGMPDAEAEDEFLAKFTYQFLQSHGFNHGQCEEQALARSVQDVLDQMAQNGPEGYQTFSDYLMSRTCENSRTAATEYDNLKKLLGRDGMGTDGASPLSRGEDIAESKRQLYTAMRGACLSAGQALMKAGAEPFVGNYKLESSLWRMFRDNPDLDVAVTNVCVCTRSNPSLLMHLAQDLGTGNDTLVVRDADGTPREIPGAMGTMNVYVDSHTADSKNIDYTSGESSRPGRNYGAQEDYAIDAKKAGSGFLAYLLENDATMPDRIAAMNRKLMMHGFMLSLAPDDKSGSFEPFRTHYLADVLDDIALQPEGNGVYTPADKSGPAGPYAFVDVDALGRDIAEMAFNACTASKKFDSEAALSALGELDFSRFLSPDDPAAVKGSADDMLHRMFEGSFARYGGSFMMLPDNLKDCALGSAPAINGTAVVDGGAERPVAPLFLSSHEVTNSESELVSSHVDDRYQFQAFKAALASSMLGYLSEAKVGMSRFLDADQAKTAQGLAEKAFTESYEKMQHQKSLSLSGMNNWMKKNIFKATNAKSLTCVWSGDPTMEIDEAGISFDKALALGILKERDDIPKEALKAIPDTYECMAEKYKPLTEDDMIIVNRSPGQTTGCIRAFRARIVSAHGDGMKINPAVASIFDGDFDGDTVGGSNVLCVSGLDPTDPDYAAKVAAAKHDMRTRLSMAGSILDKASYEKNPVLPDGTVHTASDMHGLFIAGNADFAQAKRNMKAGGACGYDLDLEFSRITCMANMIEQVRQCAYDQQNRDRGMLPEDSCRAIVKARLALVEDLSSHFAAGDAPGATARDDANDRFWAGVQERFAKVSAVLPESAKIDEQAKTVDGMPVEPPMEFQVDLESIEKLEKSVSMRIKSAYREMCGYMTAPSMTVHGSCHHEILSSVIDGANACKKGKLPQLNALLKFSGVHAECTSGVTSGNPAPRLRVVNEDGKFKLEYGHTEMTGTDKHGSPVYEFTPCDPPAGGFDPAIKMSNIENTSDVKATRFRTKEIVNLVAQSDKSDATGLGGTLAQRMQMLLAPFGYGELALRISGPITQRYLDAKQNVLDCETNLTIGKSILTPVYHFKRVKELSNAYMGTHTRDQAYNGSFTVLKDPLTPSEGVAQMDNFLELMGHPRMSEIDKAQFRAVLEQHADRNGQLSNVLSKKEPRMDIPYNLGYRIMYGGEASLESLLPLMAKTHLGLYHGTCYNEAAAGCAAQVHAAVAEKTAEQVKDATPSKAVERFMIDVAKEKGPVDRVFAKPGPTEDLQSGNVEQQAVSGQLSSNGGMAKMAASLAAMDSGFDDEEEELGPEDEESASVPGE